MALIDDEIEESEGFFNVIPPKSPKSREKAALFIKMNREFRDKISYLLENIEQLMKN
jgi:hypothetical protein